MLSKGTKRTQKPLGIMDKKKQTQKDRWCACKLGFLGFYGLFGWVHLGMVHRCLTSPYPILMRIPILEYFHVWGGVFNPNPISMNNVIFVSHRIVLAEEYPT